MNLNLKYARLVEVGDTIRGYDFRPFAGRPSQFIEGKVTAKCNYCGFDAYQILVENDSGETYEGVNRVGEEAYIPFETSMDWNGRVELIHSVNEMDSSEMEPV